MKIFNKFYLVAIAFVAFACHPYEDTLEEIEANAPGPIANIEITLTDEEYEMLEGVEGAENVVDYGNFSSEEDVRQFIPVILAEKYPLFDNGSSVKVNYDFYRGGSSDARTYSRADQYQVTEDDYTQIDGDAAAYNVFTSAQPAESYVPLVLKRNYPAATEDDLLLVTYKYAEEVNDPSVNVVMDKAEYQSLVDYTEAERGVDWLDDYGTLEYFYGSNSYHRNFDGRIDKRKGYITNNNLTDDLFVGSESLEEDSLRIEARTQEGIQKFLEINYPSAVAQVNGTPKFYFVRYTIYYGFTSVTYYVKYQVETTAPNLSFKLIEGPSTTELSSNTEFENRGGFYVFNGSDWEEDDNAYYLSSADYDAMGAPGRYDNFSSSVLPDDYLPALLEEKYPYVQEEEGRILVYKYFSSGDVQTRGDLYSQTNGIWNKYESLIQETLQFGKEEGQWVPDNTIAYTLSGDDYATIGAIETENGNPLRGDNVASFGNFYQNFPGGDTHWTDEDIASVLGQFLKQKYPDAAVGQKYLITYLVYTGAAVEKQVKLILNESGEYVVVE